ncbi:DUF3429 domain-containing protein [Taklimakanibacter lacteus]|uniref:DUF3429 domain-containing protein n=1 Tax=Taklimakanibacter lacteus TaxID=2268456 RepID=UPI000E672CD2
MLQGDGIPRPALAIGLMALLPFVILLILVFSLPSAGRLVQAFLSYAALLAALLGGAHWALATGAYGSARRRDELLFGLVPLLAAWLALLMPPTTGLTFLIAGFFLILLRDALTVEGFAPWFLRLRSYIAAVAIVSSTMMLIRTIS